MVEAKRKQRAVVICPGRGTYNKEELGYLKRHHKDKVETLSIIDQQRKHNNQPAVTELDGAAKYNMATHTVGENASSLIYACAYSDFLAIDQDQYEIVAVTGNSMGWYIALAVSGALNQPNAAHLINSMGSMMTDGLVGGQLIYPLFNPDWTLNSDIKLEVSAYIKEVNKLEGAELYVSIYLGGFLVLGGNKKGLAEMTNRLPRVDDTYPMQLFNHAAFHTPLLQSVSERALNDLPSEMFETPMIPLIDGQGKIWQPYSTDTKQLHQYTLTSQVTQPYNFSQAIEVALKEFAPDKLIILGPGRTLGGAVGQCLVANKWCSIDSKSAFIDKQKTEPFVLAMGLEEQRNKVLCRA